MYEIKGGYQAVAVAVMSRNASPPLKGQRILKAKDRLSNFLRWGDIHQILINRIILQEIPYLTFY